MTRVVATHYIKVLNYVATARAEDHLIIGLPIVQKAFSNFVDALENDRPQPNAVNETTSRIGNAYYCFWKSVEDVECLIKLISSPYPPFTRIFSRRVTSG